MEEPLSAAHARCYLAFESIVLTLEKPARNAQVEITPSDIYEEFDKYNIWAGNVGAAHAGKRYKISLDYRLRQASLVREQIFKLLTTLEERLSTANLMICQGPAFHGEQEYSDSRSPTDSNFGEDWEEEGRESEDSPWEISSDSSNEDKLSSQHQPTRQNSDELRSRLSVGDNPGSNLLRLMESIKFIINCLYRLPIRKAAPLDRLEHKTSIGSSLYQHFDVFYVKDKFPGLSDQVANRLGKMITQRRQILNYRKAHRESLNVPTARYQRMNSSKGQFNSLLGNGGLKTAVEDHNSQAISNRLAPSQPASSDFTLRSKATTLWPEELTLSAPEERLNMLPAPSVAETNSRAASSYAGKELRVDVPPRPRNDNGDKLEQFECPYCCVTKHIPSDRIWRTHVFEDLMPYVCTYGDCDLYDHFFESRNAWFHHELQQHRTKWFCNIDDHLEYDREEDFLLHMQTGHSQNFDGQQFSIVKGMFRRPTRSLVGTCNLCNRISTNLKYHLSRHLQQMALFALPRVNETTKSGRAETDPGHNSCPSTDVLSNQISALSAPTSDISELEVDHVPGEDIPDMVGDEGWHTITDEISKARGRTFRRLQVIIIEMDVKWREKIAGWVGRLQVELLTTAGRYNSAADVVRHHASPDVVIIGEAFGPNSLAKSIHQTRDVTDLPIIAVRQSVVELQTSPSISNWTELHDPNQHDIEEALERLCQWSAVAPQLPPATLFPNMRGSQSPVLTMEPIPVLTMEPIPVLTIEPSPVLTIEPSPVLTIEPSPVLTIEPSPVLTIEPRGRPRSSSRMHRLAHRVEAEAPPESFANMAEVQEALIHARALMQRIATVLSSSSLQRENESRIQSLSHQATRLENFELPCSRTVALVGDSGVGKSSVINSLLDTRNFARTSGSGTACTLAITEYHYHEREDFVAHVEYFPIEDVKTQLEEFLRAYRDFQLVSDHPNFDAENVTDSVSPRLQERAKLAIETFTACFGERYHEMPGILLSTPFERAVATMIEWTSQLLPRQVQQITFSTSEDCASWFQSLSPDTESSLPSETNSSLPSGNCQAPWPFIQKVRVYLKAYILSKGLIIADLPGLRDLNSARQAMTERYVRQCHQILIIARISRAATDQSIKQIFELALRAHLSKVDIVCTHSEDIQMAEAIHDWPAERVKIKAMQRSVVVSEEDIEELQDAIDDYEQELKNENPARDKVRELLALRTQHREAQRAKQSHEFDLKHFIMTLRNDKVARLLQGQYRHSSIATSLRVFSVSNTMYWENREKAAEIALPHLRSSGILELRSYCIGIVAQSQLQAIQMFIKDNIPTLIGSIQLWVEATSYTSAESKIQVLDAALEVQQELDKLMSPVSALSHLSRTMMTSFNNQIYMRMRNKGPQWSSDARQASSSWAGWHHSSYKAFCSHYGDYATSATGYRCWNHEAIVGMAEDLSIVWDSFATDLQTTMERFDTAALHGFAKILETIRKLASDDSLATDEVGSAIQTLASTLQHREHLMRYDIEQITEAFELSLSYLRDETLLPVRTAFIGNLLEQTYHAANMEFGTGSDLRRKRLVTDRFSSPILFETHRRKCKEKFSKLVQDFQEDIIRVMNEHSRLVQADLQTLRDGNGILENGRDIHFESRVREEVQSVKATINLLGKVVDRI